MAAFIWFRNTCFSEHHKKWMLSSKSNQAIFFSEYFFFKELPKKTRTFILASMMRGNSIIAFHHNVFITNFYATTLQKLFFTDET